MKAIIVKALVLTVLSAIIILVSSIPSFAASNETISTEQHRSIISYIIQQEISSEQAVKIAYNHAGVDRQDVIFPQVEVHISDEYKTYSIKFYVGLTEYTYDIDSATGKINSFEAIDYGELCSAR